MTTSPTHAADSTSASPSIAIFAGGCFWCTQADFNELPGVISTRVGYTGGQVVNPTYDQVSSGTTGHREAIEITFDPTKISYDTLLHRFWRSIDPTDPQGQFYDKGSQYLTAIYYTTPQQKTEAQKSLVEVQQILAPTPIATDILPAAPFYPAEEYHQCYYQKSPLQYNGYKYGSGRPGKLQKIWGDK